MLEKFPIKKLKEEEFPKSLFEIPDCPKKLFIIGTLPDENIPKLAIVGSRKYTRYGKDVCEKLIQGLKGYNICIVSGLALGIDAIAHEEAIKAGLPTIAVPGSGLGEDVLYPRSHIPLAKRILENNGCLLSELEENEKAASWTFPRRNRIMAGIAQAILIIEAERVSGTLITARLGTEYNKDVLTVPGSIFSNQSEGPHLLLTLGATPIRTSEDILDVLNIQKEEKNNLYNDCNDDEMLVINLLNEPKEKENLYNELNWELSKLNEVLTLLEIKGIIKESAGKIFLL